MTWCKSDYTSRVIVGQPWLIFEEVRAQSHSNVHLHFTVHTDLIYVA